MKIGNIEVNNPVFLGPMAGVTDWAYRTTCARLGAGVTVTEMVSWFELMDIVISGALS